MDGNRLIPVTKVGRDQQQPLIVTPQEREERGGVIRLIGVIGRHEVVKLSGGKCLFAVT